ncbi:hypothetical protein BC830DRAFT_408675 [Chytriomyces sp. MP71]|nr:hypothetical protein BC830DRAFT_408675 [Chytriomyces sp. MP71]
MQKLTPTPGPSSRLSLSLSPQPLTIRNTPTSSPGLGSAQNLIDDSLADGASEIFEDARSFLDTASSSYPTPPDSRRASTATTTPSTTDLDRKLSTHSLSSSALDEPSFQPPSDPYAVQPATGGNWFFDYVRSWIPVSSPAEMYNSTRMPGGFESGSVLEEFDAYCAGEFSVLEDTAGVSTVFDQVTISRPRKDGTVRRTLRLNVNHFADLDENASIAHGSILRRGSMSSLLGDDSSIVSFASSMLSQGMGRHFPMINLVDNLSRYCRYATASYGSEFMTVFDVGNIRKLKHVNDPSVPMNHVAFATHVNIPVEDILHSSFNDPQPLPSEEEKIEPVVHYVSLDREAGVVVVTLRGTLSLSDLLIDLKFDYATYKGHHVHAGMLHTATLLWQRDSCLFKAVHQALTANPSYGLVLIGHSLGGGVATLLAHEWSTPSTLPKAPTPYSTNPASGLPPHRPLHCYSFGTPCVVSHTLSTALQPYTTTVIHGNDMIPTMSVGLIRDLKTVTFHLLDPVNRGLSEKVIARTLALQARGAQPTPDESDFFYSVISSLRGSMRNARLYPGGTVYWVSHTAANAGGAAASHVVLRRCEDVREICHEPVFSARMMSDHVPKSYEDCIGALKAAVDAKREE